MRTATDKKSAKVRKAEVPVMPRQESKPQSKPESVAVAPRVVKRGSCSTLNAKGELEYEVGVDGRGDVQLRVVENSGSGSFSDEWVGFRNIQAAFDRAPKAEPVSAHMLLPLFRGKSSNCCYFCAAVLKSEGVLRPSEKRKKHFDRVDPAEWLVEVRNVAEGRAANATGDGSNTKPAVPKAAAGKAKKSNKAAKT
jgi:hypothetical protein